ncbi:MAG TPA: SurA N-terminal domain-containing protein [Candidatus Acidoferrum sp.]|jgi:peptidyl-prolyl cis-trans isomerase D|nr:SurA N-terminal domain-containing protein [Candidatus Acidoferrum sp.]
MLEGIRRYQYSWQVQVTFAFLALIMAFWGFGAGMFNTVHPIATVNGQQILGDQVDREAEQLRAAVQQMYGANAQSVLKSINIRQEAVERLIEQQLIGDEAHHLGISISDVALQDKIAKEPVFQRDGQFDFDTYQDVLRNNNLLPAEYEGEERDRMIADTLRNMIDSGVQVSDDEARHVYNLANEKIGLRYIEVPYEDFAAKISPTETQIADYYKKNAEQFREPERIKLTVVHYDPLVLAAKYTPPDKEVEDYYKRNASTRFTHPAEVSARHILIAVPAGATDKEKAAAKAKAAGVLKQAQAGGDFVKLAAKYSDDPSNKLQGGDLGSFGRGQMVKPFEDAVFAMKPGQIAMVETMYGYHIVKLDSSKPAHIDTLAEAKPKIIDELRLQAGAKLGRAAAQDDLTAALSGGKLEDLAKKRGLEATETPLFAQGEPAGGLEQDRELMQSAFKLDAGQVALVPEKGAPYVIKLLVRQPSRIPPLKEIETQVREAVIRTTAQEQASAQAQKILATIKSPADFDKAAAANNLAVKNVDPFSRADRTVPGIGEFPEVTDASATVPAIPGVVDHVMESGGNSYLFEVTSRTEPTDDEWKSAQKSFMQEYVEQRRAQAWTRFLDSLKDQAKINIDSDQLAASGSAT